MSPTWRSSEWYLAPPCVNVLLGDGGLKALWVGLNSSLCGSPWVLVCLEPSLLARNSYQEPSGKRQMLPGFFFFHAWYVSGDLISKGRWPSDAVILRGIAQRAVIPVLIDDFKILLLFISNTLRAWIENAVTGSPLDVFASNPTVPPKCLSGTFVGSVTVLSAVPLPCIFFFLSNVSVVHDPQQRSPCPFTRTHNWFFFQIFFFKSVHCYTTISYLNVWNGKSYRAVMTAIKQGGG